MHIKYLVDVATTLKDESVIMGNTLAFSYMDKTSRNELAAMAERLYRLALKLEKSNAATVEV